MRKLFFTSATIISISLFGQGGKTNQGPGSTTITPGGGKIATTQVDKTATQTPEIVREKFRKEFPEAKPSWKSEGENYSATYIDQKTQLKNIIVYDKGGNVLRKENELDPLNYPSGISEHYKKNYPAEKYSVWQTEEKSGERKYYGTRSNKIQWFDENGEIILRKKNKEPLIKEEPKLRQANPK
jgi:hypothetical protein